MKILVAGLGSIGRRHALNLLALGQRDLVFYRTGLGSALDEELAGFPAETDLNAALAHQPEAAIIANPTALHVPVAIAAAEAGCSLLIEKPVSHSMERLDELKNAIATGGGKCLIGYHFRYHPGLLRIKELLKDGQIEHPLSVRAHWGEYLPDWHPWEDYRQGYSARSDLGGGVILTLSHPLDYLRWIFGNVESLWAFSGQSEELGLQVEDTAEIGLRFISGVIGSLHLDYLQHPATHTMELIGTQGTVRWDGQSGELALYSAESKQWEAFPPLAGFERNSLFMAEMRHFLRVCRGLEEPCCTLDDGIAALRLALAAHASQNTASLIYL